jgi:hypothetical protein
MAISLHIEVPEALGQQLQALMRMAKSHQGRTYGR